jgi:putative nucleotidyltransferase with HDIG domain
LNARLRLYIVTTVAAASVLLAAAVVIWPVRPEFGGLAGVIFWTGLTFLASVLPVRLPNGLIVSVAFAPLVAAMVLGGPVAIAVVSLLGTFDLRELRGKVPWYGMVNDRACFVIAAISAGAIYELLAVPFQSTAGSLEGALLGFGVFIIAAAWYFAVNTALSVTVVHLRTGVPFRTLIAADIAGVTLSLFGLAPVGWLMAQVFQLPNGIGWWATPLFVVPLFTTRLAYARYVETRELFEQTIGALANAVDARDRYTRGHSNRVSHISEAMGRVMRLAESEIERIKWAGLLHDIGKIGIRDNILLKEGPLDREERILMNQHPSIGAEIVGPATQLADEAPLIRAHHEWFNGSGYPDGIEALDIPIGARIMTIADAYEAMTSSRPYRKQPLSHEQAVAELEKYAGIQFDPDIVPILVNLDREILDRPPDRPDELPTMLQAPDPRDRPQAEEPKPVETDPRAAIRGESVPKARPLLASDDVS